MVNEILEMDSFIAIQDVLNGVTLHPKQCIDVIKMLYQKRSILIYDTGTGKTLLAAAFMRMLIREDPSRRFIFFCIKDQITQTPKKLESLMGVPVLVSTADAKSVDKVLQEDLLKYKVIMLTHQCLHSSVVLNYLYTIRQHITGIIVDEAHKLNNTSKARSADVLQAMLAKFEYVAALTATPIRSDLLQLVKLANLIAPDRYPNTKKLLNDLKSGYFSVDADPCFFINRAAEELGRTSHPEGHVVWCTPHTHQVEESRGGVFLMQTCKGKNANSQVRELIKLLQSKSGQKGLVYISQQTIYDWVTPHLTEAGIKFAIIQGSTSASDRESIMSRFNDPEDTSIDVVLLSVTTAVDLDCEYVVFYEFTVDVKQLMGRAHRGLENKVVQVYFLLTKGTGEVQYFIDNIYNKCELFARILGKEDRAILEVGEKIGLR